VQRQVLDAEPQEFPRCDERRTGQPYRYAYTVPLAQESAALGARSYLLKHDLQTGRRECHDFGAQRFPGEFVFVPSHPDAAEDEGWLMGLVVDMARETTALVILDAQRFTQPPLALVHLPHRVPAGFHGNWVATS
jgi:8'-apo-carotenoid 13,14-cleaving dioxygenase